MMRELLRQHFAVRIEAEPIEREAITLVSIGWPISSLDLQDSVEILPDGKTMKSAIGLKRQADPTAYAPECEQVRDVFSLEQHAARIGPVNAAQQGKERGFSGAI